MNKEKILLIFQCQSRIDYWFSWFRKNYQHYITLMKKTTKEVHLKNGTVLYFKTLEDNLRGLKCDKEFNGERLELLCLNYENKELHNKIDKAIKILKEHFVEEYIRSCDTSDGVGRYEIDTEHWTYKVYEQLKDSDIDE